jgi:hypothetical protein
MSAVPRRIIAAILVLVCQRVVPAAAQDATWVLQSPTNSPLARDSHAMAYDDARQRIVLFGGHHEFVYLNDTWLWDGTNWTQSLPANSPPERYFPAMAYDSARQQTVLFGGAGQGYYYNDTWISDQYTYVWKTDRAWANTCRQLMLKLSDGSVHTANFRF